MPVSNLRFDQLIQSWEPRLKAAFLDAVYALRDGAQVGLIAEKLERGDVEGAIRAVGLDPVKFRSLDATLSQAFESGGKFTIGQFPALREPSGHLVKVLFDVRNIAAENWLRDHSSRLVSQIVEDQATMLRQTLTAGMEAGTNPRTVALDIVGKISAITGKREGGLLGLTASQEKWVSDFRAALTSDDPRQALSRGLRDNRFDPTIERAFREGKPIPADKLENMVAAFKNRALRYRATAIARTEALTSLHAAAYQATEQAIAKGQIQEAAVEKVWHNSADKRVRDTHQALGGQAVGFRADFVSPSGARLQYPGDPNGGPAEVINCRCWADYRIDFLKGIR